MSEPNDFFVGQFLHALTQFDYFQTKKSPAEIYLITKRKNYDLSMMHQRVNGNENKQCQSVYVQMRKNQWMEKYRERANSCYFNMEQVKYQNQREYIEKNNKFGILCHLQKAMLISHIDLSKKYLKNMLDKKHKYWFTYRPLTVPEPQKYLHFISKLLSKKKQVRQIDWIQNYRQFSNNKFWDILYRQTSSIRRSNTFLEVLCNSIKIVQQEVRNLLPKNQKELQKYISVEYVGKCRDTNLTYEEQKKWAYAYVYNMAGLQSQFYNSLPSSSLITHFQSQNSALKQKMIPHKVIVDVQSTNAFENQLHHFLSGQYHLASQIFGDENSFDRVYILLRTLGVYGKQTLFNELRMELFEQYQMNSIEVHQIYNILYLLGYYEIAMMGPNSILNQADYLIFLVAITNNPYIRKLLSLDRLKQIEIKLGETIQWMIQFVILMKECEPIKYLLTLYPESIVLERMSQLLVSQDLLEKIDWESIDLNYGRKTVDELQFQIYRKYGEQTLDFVRYATQYYHLFQNHTKTIELIINMCSCMPNNSTSFSLSALLQQIYLHLPQELLQYKPVLSFILLRIQLQQALSSKQSNPLLHFLTQKILHSKIDLKNKSDSVRIAALLSARDFTNFYLQTIKKINEGIQKCFRAEQLSKKMYYSIKTHLDSNITYLLEFQDIFPKSHQAHQFIKQLESELPELSH